MIDSESENETIKKVSILSPVKHVPAPHNNSILHSRLTTST